MGQKMTHGPIIECFVRDWKGARKAPIRGNHFFLMFVTYNHLTQHV